MNFLNTSRLFSVRSIAGWYRLQSSSAGPGSNGSNGEDKTGKAISKTDDDHLSSERDTSDVTESKTKLTKSKGQVVGPAQEPKRGFSIDDPKPAWQMIKKEFTSVGPVGVLKVPRETDILIIGGGLIGSSVAFWLKARHPTGYHVTVVERDPTYKSASSTLSVGGIRTQFSCPENIQMSLASIEFMRDLKEHLNIPGLADYEPPSVNFNQQGYLIIASENGAEQLKKNHQLQESCGAHVDLMTPDQLKNRFPWINMDGIALASYGISNEGWFDPWSLMEGFKRKAISLGAQYVKGEVIGFEHKSYSYVKDDMSKGWLEHIQDVLVKTEDNNTIYPVRTAMCVNCAGPWAGEIAKMCGIGEGTGQLRVPLPVQPRKRYVYIFHCPEGPALDCPMFIDNSGVYFRREGMAGNYLCGASPESEHEEPEIGNLDVDYDFFYNTIWPKLAARVPAFEKLKLKSAWAGYYDYNYMDQNLVIGQHPYHTKFYFANGSSGHGVQHAIAIGRAVSERILESKYRTIDLSRFHFNRFMDGELVKETSIY